jgi:hypothetical protein
MNSAAAINAELLGALELITEGMEMMQRKGLAAKDLQMVKVARAAIAKANAITAINAAAAELDNRKFARA